MVCFIKNLNLNFIIKSVIIFTRLLINSILSDVCSADKNPSNHVATLIFIIIKLYFHK